MRSPHDYSYLFVVLALACAACSGSDQPATDAGRDGAGGDGKSSVLKVVDTCTLPSAGASINSEGDVEYASGRRLDISWPKGNGPFPLVILIHGGGWSGGDKAELAPFVELLAGAGYAAATLNYRLAQNPQDLFPACVEDVRCAVRWLRSQASKYSIDPKRVVVAGPSAGGMLSSMLALAENVSGLDGAGCSASSQPVGVSGAISYYGPSDLRSNGALGAGEENTLPNLFGKPPEEAPTLATLASPIVHVHAGAPPMLLIHGTDDAVAPISHSRNLKTALDGAKVPSLLVEVPGQGHDFALFSSEGALLRSSCTALAFLEALLK